MPGPGSAVTSSPDTGKPPAGIGAAVVAYAIGTLVASLLIAVALGAGANQDAAVTTVVGLAGLWVGLAGVPLYLSRTRGSGRLADDFGLRLAGWVDLARGIAAAGAALAFEWLYGTVLPTFDKVKLDKGTDKTVPHGVGLAFWAVALAVAIGAPVVEELFFRGLLQPSLQRRLGAGAGVVGTAVVFGLAHVGNNPLEAAVPLAVFGLVVGWLAWRTGRLGPGIVAHVVFNSVTIAVVAATR